MTIRVATAATPAAADMFREHPFIGDNRYNATAARQTAVVVYHPGTSPEGSYYLIDISIQKRRQPS